MMPTTKCITWRDPSGFTHVRDDVPDDVICLELGGRCPSLRHYGRVLAIGSEHVVCSEGLHPIPARILMLTEDRTDYVIVETKDAETMSQDQVIARFAERERSSWQNWRRFANETSDRESTESADPGNTGPTSGVPRTEG